MSAGCMHANDDVARPSGLHSTALYDSQRNNMSIFQEGRFCANCVMNGGT